VDFTLKRILLTILITAAPATIQANDDRPVDFSLEVQPLIEAACLRCHHEKKAEGGLRLDTLRDAITGGDTGPAIVPGKPQESLLYTYCPKTTI